MAFLEIQELTKDFGAVHAVNSANIQVEKGSFFTFLGPSGCGKTTTLRMVAGFEHPTSGRVVMDGKDITQAAPERRQIGMMFQNYALFPHMTVFENVAYGPKIKRMPGDKIRESVERYLGMVGLSGYDKRKITQLSGGEQQRVALARSLATEPKILLLDEPLSNLDAKMRDEMRFELKRLQYELGITMLYVTHDQSEALMMSDKIAVFYKGVIQQIGEPSQIYARPANTFVANFVGQTNLIPLGKNQGETVSIGDGHVLQVAEALPGAKWVSVRGEYILLGRPEEERPGYNRLPGVVKACQFNGMTSYYTIQVGEILLEVTVTNNGLTPSFAKGDGVAVLIHPSRIVLLEV